LKFDAEVVDNEGEGDAIGGMPKQAYGASLVVTMGGEAFNEDVLGNFSGMR
jgi:hypothetical protein